MDKEEDVAEISPDGKTLSCRSPDGKLKWSTGAPSRSDWCSLTKRNIDGDVEAGTFRYVERGVLGFIIAAFTPYGGLNFNLKYTADTGKLIRIDEAR